MTAKSRIQTARDLGLESEALLGRAAVSHFVDPGLLAEQLGSSAEIVANLLFPDVVAERDSADHVRWTLRPAIRRRTLAQAGRDRALTWIEATGDEPTGDTERVLHAWIKGNLDVARELRHARSSIRQVASWLRGCDWLTPPSDEVMSAIARDELRQQLERSTSSRFVGRVAERAKLQSLLASGAVLLEASGGMGKSALLSQLMLDRGAFVPGGPVVAVLDFDNPTLTPLDPAGLFAELARQVGLQAPELLGFEESFREHAALHRSREADGLVVREAAGAEDSRIWGLLNYFLKKLSNACAAATIVFDTVERVPRNAEPRLEQLMKELSSLLRPHRNVSLLIAGRGPFLLPSLKGLPHLALKPFPHDEARQMLEGLGVPAELWQRVLELVVPTPLTLRLVARAVQQLGAAAVDDAELRTAVQRAQVDGYLHARVLERLPSRRLADVAYLTLPLLSVTPERLETIVGPLLDEPLSTGESSALFTELMAISDLVAVAGDARLVLRPEVHRELLELMRSGNQARVDAVHRAALVALADTFDEEAQAEHNYHELSLDAAAPVRRSLLDRLERIAPLLPQAAQRRVFEAARRMDVAGTVASPSPALESAGFDMGSPAPVAAALAPAADPDERALMIEKLVNGDPTSSAEETSSRINALLPHANAWHELAAQDRTLMRRAASRLGTPRALAFAANAGAFEWSEPLIFDGLAKLLVKSGSALRFGLGDDLSGVARRLEESQRSGSLGTLVLLLISNDEGNVELCRNIVKLLEQMTRAVTAPLQAVDVLSRAEQLTDLAAELALTLSLGEWSAIVEAVSPYLLQKSSASTDFRLAVHNSLVEMDRRKLLSDLVAQLRRVGRMDLAQRTVALLDPAISALA